MGTYTSCDLAAGEKDAIIIADADRRRSSYNKLVSMFLFFTKRLTIRPQYEFAMATH